MATTTLSFSTDPALADRLRTEAGNTGLKQSTIISMALRDRYAAQDTKTTK